jgi:hypothetical protein
LPPKKGCILNISIIDHKIIIKDIPIISGPVIDEAFCNVFASYPALVLFEQTNCIDWEIVL